MALIDSEGFGMSLAAGDYVTSGAFITAPNNVQINGPLGDNFCQFDSAVGNQCRRRLPQAVSTFFWGARIQQTSGTQGWAFEDDSGNNQITVNFNTNSTIQVFRNGTLIGTSSGFVVPISSWFYMEVGAVIAGGTSGSVEVRVNGATVLSLTGVNTLGNVSGVVQRVHIVISANSGFGQHWYCCDNSGGAPWNTFLGDIRVQTVFPTSNDVVQFTPNGLATNWQNAAKVNPVPFTDYNSDNVVGDQDTFNTGTLPANLTSVLGVHVKTLQYKTDAGSRSMQTVLKSGATTALGTSTALAVNSNRQQKTMYQTDPDTGVQWTQAAANAAKPGYKISA